MKNLPWNDQLMFDDSEDEEIPDFDPPKDDEPPPDGNG